MTNRDRSPSEPFAQLTDPERRARIRDPRLP
jgi:hypothetical protein